MARWQERISRKIVKSLMRFPSVADGLFELIDNPVDYRKGRKLEVSVLVDKVADRIVVEDHGGQGMDAEGIEDWLNWGSGHPHEDTHIGLYHQGGKAACGYLAKSLVLYAKAAGSPDVWKLEDDEWVEREALKDWGEPQSLGAHSRSLPPSIRGRPIGEGFVRIELSRLNAHRYNLDTLLWRLSSCYRSLLDDGDLLIKLNGDRVLPLELPLSSAFNAQRIDLKTDLGHKLRGWVGRLDRDAVTGWSVKKNIPGGMRCVYQKRLICDGQYFGHYGAGKGTLLSLIGELHVDPRIKPNHQKNSFDTDSLEWAAVEDTMHGFLAPIVAQFRRAGESKPASREEKKRLGQVCHELSEAFRRLQQDRAFPGSGEVPTEPKRGSSPVSESVVGLGGRKRPEPRGSGRPEAPGGTQRSKGEITNHTEPPDDPVGKLTRLLTRISGGSLRPPAVLDSLGDRSQRSDWRKDNGTTKLVVNTDFPLYVELKGAEGYLAETIILKLAEPQEGDPKSLDDYLAEVNNLLVAWASVHREETGATE